MRSGATVRPNVPIMFCEARALAEEWIYRFLAVAHAWAATEAAATERLIPLAVSAAATELAAAPGLPEPSTAEVRAWARATGLAVSGRGEASPGDLGCLAYGALRLRSAEWRL